MACATTAAALAAIASRLAHAARASRAWLAGLAWLTLLSLTGCSAGNNDGQSGTPIVPVPVTLTVQGVARFDAVPHTSAGALNYAGTVARPIRGATVQLINDQGTPLASSTTDASGAYTLGPVSASGGVRVRVRSELKRSGSYDVSVRDNTQGDALYVLDSLSFIASPGLVTHNLHAGSGWGGAGYTLTRSAAPFAVLDTAYQAMSQVLGVSPNQAFPALDLLWSPNNRSASGAVANGDIGTSRYEFDGTRHRIYLLGQANVDTDEYDAHVVAHEWGHYYQSALSRDDSVGGSHGTGDLLDMSVAFSEGFGNAWSGIVLADPRYADSDGPSQASGFIIDISQTPASGDLGWYSESSVQHLLWHVHQEASLGLPALHRVMTGPLRSSSLLAAVHNFSALLKADTPAAASLINSQLAALQITDNNSDGLGTGETNDGGVPRALPVYASHLSSTQAFCTTDAAAQPFNGLGLYVHIRFTLPSAGTRTLQVTAQSPTTGSNPNFTLIQPDGSTRSSRSATPDSETLSAMLSAGAYTLTLSDNNQTNGNATGERCFNLRIQ